MCLKKRKIKLFGHIIFKFKLTVLTQVVLTLDLAVVHGHSNIKEMKPYVTKFIRKKRKKYIRATVISVNTVNAYKHLRHFALYIFHYYHAYKSRMPFLTWTCIQGKQLTH